MFKVNTNPETGKVSSLHLSDVTFSYSYLVSPRPETDFSPGTYGSELIIDDMETIKGIKEYLNEVLEEAKSTVWDGKLPKKLNLPLKKGREDKELEVGKFILKTSTKNQPKLFIREEDETRAREVTEENLDEIYAGMIGEAVVKFKAYSYNGINGVKAYLNAVCKTGTGTPLTKSVSYEDVFSGETDFDKPAPEPQKKVTKTESSDEVDLDSMLSSQPTTSKAETTNLTIDDLLNS